MKAIDINGDIKIYKSLPKQWNSDNGLIINFNKAGDDIHAANGFYPVVKPSHDSRIELLSDIYWDADNNIFTYDVSDKTISETLEELKDAKKQEVKNLAYTELIKTDWYVSRNAELSTDIPEEVVTERAEIRAKVIEREAEIDALTTKKKAIQYNAILFDPILPETTV